MRWKFWQGVATGVGAAALWLTGLCVTGGPGDIVRWEKLVVVAAGLLALAILASTRAVILYLENPTFAEATRSKLVQIRKGPRVPSVPPLRGDAR